MRRRHFCLLVVICLLVILLTLANFLASINNRDELHDSIQNSLAVNQTKNEETIRQLVEKYVAQIQPAVVKDGVNGQDGKNGSDGAKGAEGEPGKDGEKGQDGKDGNNGRPGRELELATDELGNILWRYAGDDFWTVAEVVEVL